MKTLDERIKILENFYSEPNLAGTTIQRIFAKGEGNGVEWSLGLGRLLAAKQFFIGNTIEECVEKAEKHVENRLSKHNMHVKLGK